jgi:hypothetical protein
MDLVREGLYFRGNFELQRQNFGKAYDAFKAAGDYRNSLFKLAVVTLEASQPPQIVIEHLFSALEAGQLIALPWLHVLINQQDELHPKAKEIEEIFEKYRQEKHPTVIGQMGEISLRGKSYDEALIYFKEAALSGDVHSKQKLGEILSDRAWWSEIYECMLTGGSFNFEGFPFKPELEPLGEIDPIFKDELNPSVSDEMFKFLTWIYDQGPVEERHYRSIFALYKSKITYKKLPAIAEYDALFKGTFGYPGSVTEDIDLIMVFANDLLQCSRIPDLGLCEFLMTRFGVKDLFDEMVAGVMASESKKQVDETFMSMTSFTYKSDFSLKKAIAVIPVDYSLPCVNQFIKCCEELDFNAAEILISELVKDVKFGRENSKEEFANLIEFIERAKYEFDFLPTRLLTFARNKFLEAVNEAKSADLRNYLLSFRPKDEKPYYLDDFELILTSKGK